MQLTAKKVFEKNRNKVSGATILGVAVFFFVSVFTANAQEYNYVIQSSDSVAGSLYGNWLSFPFTGVAGAPSKIRVSVAQSDLGGAMPTNYKFGVIRQCDDAAMSINCANVYDYATYYSLSQRTHIFTSTEVPALGCHQVDVTLPATNFSFDSSKYYYIQFSRDTLTKILKPCGTNLNPLPQWPVNSTSGDAFDSYYVITTNALDPIDNESLIAQSQIDGTYQTRFTSAILSASTTLTAVVNYYIDTNDFIGVYDRPDVVLVNVSNTDTTQFEQKQKFIIPLSNGNASTTINFSTPIPDGNYSAQINFWNMFGQKFVLNRSYLTINFTVSGGVVTTQSVVDSSDAIFPDSTTTYEDCGITALSGCINNSLRFLFYPSTDSIQSFSNQYLLLQGKAPFVYAYQSSDLLTGLFTGTPGVIPTISVTTDIGEITFISESQVAAIPFVPLLRSLMAAGLWLMLFVAIYRKTLSIHDKQTV